MKTLTALLIGIAVGAGAMLVPYVAARAPAVSPDPHGHGTGHDHDHAPSEEIELSATAIQAAGIVVVRAAERDLEDAVLAPGVIATNAERVAHVTPTVRGRVDRIGVSLGRTVKQGDLLAELNSVELGNAAAAFLKSKVAHAVAHANFEREERLKAKEATTELDYLQAQAADQTAEAEMKATRETLLLYGLNAAQIDALSWEQGATLSRFPISAPFDGTIIEMHLTKGELADPSDRIFTIADLSTVWAILDVPPTDAGRIRAGQQVEVRVEGVPEPVTGKIGYVGDLVRPETRTVPVWCTLENPDRRLRPGAFATAVVSGGGGRTVVVPAEAVQTIDATHVVFVRTTERGFVRVPVTPGRRRGEWQEILAGVKAGDDVVAAGSFVLKSEYLRHLMEHSH